MAARRIALLVAKGITPDDPNRDSLSGDLFDAQFRAIEPDFRRIGLTLECVLWTTDWVDWKAYEAVLTLCAWDYQKNPTKFKSRIKEIKAQGVRVINDPDLVQWNMCKTYLRDLEGKGVPTIPTIWCDSPTAKDVRDAFDTFGCDKIVVKRQIAAGARGQRLYTRDRMPRDDSEVGCRPSMIQPFMESIMTAGELSIVVIDGLISHTFVKIPTDPEGRVQEVYGGISKPVEFTVAMHDAACKVYGALKACGHSVPDIARLDFIWDPEVDTDDAASLLLIELEAIEPYLFPQHVDPKIPLGSKISRLIVGW